MHPGEREFFRISNSSADTILDLQYVFDGSPQALQRVEIDGVAVNSQDGEQPGGLIPATHFVLAPAARVGFIVSAPPPSVQLAQLVTLAINTGPLGDNDPQRPLATIELGAGDNSAAVEHVPAFQSVNAKSQRFAGLAAAPIAERRVVYFDENCPPIPNPAMPCTPSQFFMESQDNFETNGSTQSPALTGQYLDMIQVPYWDGNPNHPYPSVTVLIDFRGNDIGDFVFHCHILNHEDLGMINIIQVQSAENATNKSGQMRAMKPSPHSAKRISPAASAEVSPKALEIADRVVETTTAEQIGHPSADEGRHGP